EVREAKRHLGQLMVATETGLRVQPVARQQVSRTQIARSQQGATPALGFRLLQSDWVLTLRVEALEPWVTAQALEEITLREGLTRTRLAVRYQIENAAVKTLRLRLPTLTEDEAKTVRATGEAVGDMIPVDGETGVWEIRFLRGMLGQVPVEIQYQRATERSDDGQSLEATRFTEVRQLNHWFALRVVGRLEVEMPELPAGWQRSDWTTVPEVLHSPQERGVPVVCLRASDPEGPLVVGLRRNEVARALKLRVAKGRLTTAFSLGGASTTKVDLTVDVVENSTLRFTLPGGRNGGTARLFNAFVNGQSAAVVKEGDAYLLTVTPPENATQASVVFSYGLEMEVSPSNVSLSGPELSIPLQNVSWQVLLPGGFQLRKSWGDLELDRRSVRARVNLESYLAGLEGQRNRDLADTRNLMEQANKWILDGRQEMARKALTRASKRGQASDLSTNEDARVQLRQLQTEQAVVGLNTLRQRLYLDNRAEAVGYENAEALEKAAQSNEVLLGDLNFRPDEVSAILQGNTAEENDALKRIANRIVNQQAAAEPALQAIDVSLPPQGNTVRFSRSVQVNGSKPLELRLKLSRRQEAPFWFIGLIALCVLAIVWLGVGFTGRCCRAR
ncbi:MAG: hypothetical protein AAF514_14130, partial [Verrucomicrobiota bacterium]